MQSVRNYLRIINDDYAIIDTNWYRDISTEVEENKVQSNSQIVNETFVTLGAITPISSHVKYHF